MLEMINNQRRGIEEANANSQVLDQEILDLLDQLIETKREYFLQLTPRLYYDDISSKNVMIHNETFTGLVDLDFLRKGDYLEAIGAMMAVWHGEEYGNIYINEIIERQGLNELQQKMIRFYAILHLSMWTTEEGRRFNSNTSGTINWNNVKRKRKKILEIYQEII